MACTGRVRGQITRDSPENHGVLSRLSLKAVRSAAALEDEDFTALFKHLYTFNSIPLTSRWLERIPDSAAVWRELGLDSPSDVSAMLEARWMNVNPYMPPIVSRNTSVQALSSNRSSPRSLTSRRW